MFRKYDINKCRICRQKERIVSKGEFKIEEWLIENNINYKAQVRFEGCKNIKKLPFDFAIYNEDNSLKFLIEYDGKQHYGLGNFSSDKEKMIKNFERIKYNDNIKNEFCKENNIKLIRIPYNKYYKIKDILQDNTEITK